MLSAQELDTYNRDGFLVKKDKLSSSYIQELKIEADLLTANLEGGGRVKEIDSPTVKTVFGAHEESRLFLELTKRPELVCEAMQLIGDAVHVFQFKLNAKRAYVGGSYGWHQDYDKWQRNDGLPLAACCTAVIFLDDVDDFNGALTVIPRSHTVFPETTDGWPQESTAQNVFVSTNVLSDLVEKNGMVALKGPAGTVAFFHGNLMHASGNNISPFDRSMILVTYNGIENVPRGGKRSLLHASSDATAILPKHELPEVHLSPLLADHAN